MSPAHWHGVAGFCFDFGKHVFSKNDLIYVVNINEKLFMATYKIGPVLKHFECEVGK